MKENKQEDLIKEYRMFSQDARSIVEKNPELVDAILHRKLGGMTKCGWEKREETIISMAFDTLCQLANAFPEEENNVTKWKVNVVTTNGLQDTFEAPNGYKKCYNGILYVVCDFGEEVFKYFGSNVISVERIGVGYSKVGQDLNTDE